MGFKSRFFLDSDDFSSDSSTDEDVRKKKADKKGKKEEIEPSSANSSRSVTPIDNKRKLPTDAPPPTSNKKPKLDLPNYIPGSR